MLSVCSGLGIDLFFVLLVMTAYLMGLSAILPINGWNVWYSVVPIIPGRRRVLGDLPSLFRVKRRHNQVSKWTKSVVDGSLPTHRYQEEESIVVGNNSADATFEGLCHGH